MGGWAQMLGIHMRRCVIAGMVVAMAVGAGTAHAMQFHAIPLSDPGKVVIEAMGEIVPGDAARLDSLAAGLPSTANKVVALALDSPGGNVVEAEKIADAIWRNHVGVIVAAGGQCVSACFLLFAAGKSKVVAPDALIGVHSVSIAGQETLDSMGLTTALARDAAQFGVPPDIVGKLVETAPGRVEWLTRDDLAEMGVKIYQPNTASSSETSAPPATTTTPAPAVHSGNAVATTAVPSAPDEPPDFQQGLADRRTWEQWYSGLTGDYQQGASFWAAHRSDPKLPSCYPNGQTFGDWTAGCLAAQQRLASSDVRRRTDPTYRQGWNSY
jgi:hypothetical protein